MSDSVPSRRSSSLRSPPAGARSSCLLTALHGLWMAIAVCKWNPALGVGYVCPWTVDGSSLIEPQGEIPTHAHHTCTQHTQHTRIQTHNTHRVGCKTWICHFTRFFGPVHPITCMTSCNAIPSLIGFNHTSVTRTTELQASLPTSSFPYLRRHQSLITGSLSKQVYVDSLSQELGLSTVDDSGLIVLPACMRSACTRTHTTLHGVE